MCRQGVSSRAARSTAGQLEGAPPLGEHRKGTRVTLGEHQARRDPRVGQVVAAVRILGRATAPLAGAFFCDEKELVVISKPGRDLLALHRRVHEQHVCICECDDVALPQLHEGLRHERHLAPRL